MTEDSDLTKSMLVRIIAQEAIEQLHPLPPKSRCDADIVIGIQHSPQECTDSLLSALAFPADSRGVSDGDAHPPEVDGAPSLPRDGTVMTGASRASLNGTEV
mmetsp:Transcript_52538/g.137800  ORF Transcript_52538/g.137800 Transcript_52538/m.137800 type:complete len:102 (+) Transcript_52538:135-440(+)